MIEAIRLFSAFASYMRFIVYQMDVKSAFLYGTIEEEVYVHQPPGFLDPAHPNKVYKVIKALWSSSALVFSKESMLSQEFNGLYAQRFQMRSMGELTFFLGLQVKQQPDGIFISQDKYLKHQPKLGLWYPKDSPFELEAFSDSDYGGASLDRKSTTGGCQFLGRRLISWQCKKQTIMANSTTEAEYVAAANCCGQVLWIQNQMMDYGFNFMNTRIHIDNESTISVIKNPVAHSRTKHIKIRFHFIRDCYEKRLIEVIKIHTDSNVADLLTKGFDVTRFNFLVFWMTAKSKTINNVRYITATVAGKPVSISEASIRSDLQFNDAAGIDVLPNQAIFDTIQLIGFKKRPIEESDLSLKPSSSIPIPDSILEGSGGNHRECLHEEKIGKEEVFEEKLMQKESVSKQGRKPAKYEPTVHKDPDFDDLNDAMDYMETEDAHDEGTVKDSKETRVSTEDPVSTDKTKVSTDKLKVSIDKPNEGIAEPKDGNSDESATPTMTSTPTPIVFGDDETIAQVLITMSQNKPLPKIDPKDKGKQVLEEEPKRVQEDGKRREKKKLAEEEATKVAFTNEYDFIQARLNADKILAEKLQEEEREKVTIEQRAKFLHYTIAVKRRFISQQRSEAIRNKLPTINQLRNQMMTYLKYVGGYKHAQLNKKKFEEIQVMYEKVKRENENFIPISSAKDENLIEKMNKKADGMDKEEFSEETKKENHLKTFLKIVPEEEEKIDYEVLGTRVFKADGSSRWIKTFSEMIKFFGWICSKEDDELLEEIHESGCFRAKLSSENYVLELTWEYEEDSTMALELIRFVKKLVAELEPENSNRDEEDI
ncbi:putative ribonuclease H-like domain-containing protein [Tanacetum coccineum]